MPTYEDLRAYFDESEILRESAQRAAEVSIVRGFTIDVDPFWAWLCDREEDGSHDWPDLPPYRYGTSASPARWPTGGRSEFQGYRRRDLSRRPAGWQEVFGRDSPVIMSIIYGPLATPALRPDRFGESDFPDPEGYRRLTEIASHGRGLVRLEERPQARLAVAGGDEIDAGGSKQGTFGGTLTDRSGRQYGVTCAHVASPQDSIGDLSGNKIGTCLASTAITPLSRGSVCDPVMLPRPQPSPGNGPALNMLDVALIDLSVAPVPSQLGGTAASLTQGQNVVIRRSAGDIACKLGSLAISYAFKSGGVEYCFADTIELLPQPTVPLARPFSAMFTPQPVGGDSGSWVLTCDPVPLWAGMLFGEDGTRGFAIRASWANDWADFMVGVPLSV